MKLFQSLADLLWRKTESDAGAALRLATAYHAVFYGKASDDDQNLVLLDLADFSGFYRVNPPGVELSYYEGMRAVYGRVFRFLRMSDGERVSLENAARETSLLRERLAQGKDLE